MKRPLITEDLRSSSPARWSTAAPSATPSRCSTGSRSAATNATPPMCRTTPAQLERLEGAASIECLHAQRYLDFKAIKRLGVLLSRIRPSAVVAANPYAMLYASLALRQARPARAARW